MRISSWRLASFLAVFALLPITLQAQQVTKGLDVGFPEGGVFSGSNFDNVQLNNGNLHFEIPLLNTPGRGLPAVYKYVYDNRGWFFHETCDHIGACTDTVWGEQGNNMGLPISSLFDWGSSSHTSSQPCGSGGGLITLALTNVVLQEPDGTKHHFLPDPVNAPGSLLPCNQWAPAGSTMYADDGSGWILQNGAGAISKDGNFFSSAGGAGVFLREDTNGNEFGYNSTTVVYTDTLGRTINPPTKKEDRFGILLNHPSTFTYNDSSGTLRTVQITYTSVSVQTSQCIFSGADTCGEYGGTWSMPYQITLPNNQTYTFTYVQGSYGEPASVTLPTGAQISWTWAADGRNPGGRRVASRTVTVGSQSYTWTYTYNDTGTPPNVVVHDPLGNETRHTFGDGTSDGSPLETKVETFQGTVASGQLLKTVQTDYTALGCSGVFGTKIPIRETTTWNQTNQVTKVETDWDSFSFPAGAAVCTITGKNPIERREYAFGTGASGALVRRTHYNYLHLTNSAYRSANIANRVTSQIVYDGSGNIQAQTTSTYDGSALTSTSGVPNHDYTNFSASNLVRGNPTQVSRWVNTTGTWLNTINTFDDLGNKLTTTDPAQHITTYSYNDNWANSSCVPAGVNTHGYVTQVTNALNQNAQTSYFPCLGQVASQKDQNDINASRAGTTFTYDLLGRLTQKNLPDGGQVNPSYNDVPPISVTTTTKATASLNVVATAIADGLGRNTQSQLTSDPQGTIFTDTTYDLLGRAATVSNPHRSGSAPTDGITTNVYDALSRTCVVVPPDGTAVGGSTCPATQPTNDLFTTYSGNTTTVKDQAGKSRKSVSDGLGRLTQVFEDPSGSNYETDYSYDTLDNLLTVNQKGNDANSANWRTRTFTYNSLSQLLTASNPESGSITYTYNSDGTLATKVAPAPNQTGSATVTTTYSYDALHRLTQKSFSDSTPLAKYGYDAVALTGCATAPPTLTITNGIGRRTAMCDAAGAEAWSYDTTGRVLTDRRITNNLTKDATYTYNLDGSLASLTYPSGRTITYTLQSSGTNTAGRMLSAVDSTGPINYATAASYAPTGALSSLTNGASIISTLYYNNRLQPCRISAKFSGTAPTSCADSTNIGNVLDFTYNFSLGTSDNGNVTGITNNRPGASARSQLFTYDSLNRIATAKTTSTSGANCWDEQFGYDPWGNLLTIGRITGYTCSNEELLNVIATTKNQIGGDTYDSAGNLITIPSIASYTYDAENHLLTAGGVTYTYDGDGRRAKKSNGKLYWYGMGSDPLDETDLTGATNNASFNEYIFFGGKRIARRDSTNAVNYYFADHLGTARIVANSSGTPVDDSDFYPFGGERNYLNSSPQNYKFTGKERDSESGLDNFGARFDSSSLGRFMSPDPLMASATVRNPQTWNRYAYALNNPLRFVDPDGMKEVSAEDCKKDANCVTVNVNVIYDTNANDGKGLTDEQKKKFEKNELQKAKDEYGDSNVHFDVTYSAGSVGAGGAVTGAVAGALNVWVSDHTFNGDAGQSGKLKDGSLGSIVNINKDSDTFSHELAHHIFGDTYGLATRLTAWAADIDRALGAMVHEPFKVLADFGNDSARMAARPMAFTLMKGEMVLDARQDINRGARNLMNVINQAAIRPRQ